MSWDRARGGDHRLSSVEYRVQAWAEETVGSEQRDARLLWHHEEPDGIRNSLSLSKMTRVGRRTSARPSRSLTPQLAF